MNASSSNEREEASLDDYYLVDENNNRIEDVEPGMNVELVIQTTDSIGKTITIDLNNDTCDFKYNGEVLTNDVFSNYTISKNIERIPLEVIAQQ